MLNVAMMVRGAANANISLVPGPVVAPDITAGAFRETFVASACVHQKAVSGGISILMSAGKGATAGVGLIPAGDSKAEEAPRPQIAEANELLTVAKSGFAEVTDGQTEQAVASEPATGVEEDPQRGAGELKGSPEPTAVEAPQMSGSKPAFAYDGAEEVGHDIGNPAREPEQSSGVQHDKKTLKGGPEIKRHKAGDSGADVASDAPGAAAVSVNPDLKVGQVTLLIANQPDMPARSAASQLSEGRQTEETISEVTAQGGQERQRAASTSGDAVGKRFKVSAVQKEKPMAAGERVHGAKGGDVLQPPEVSRADETNKATSDKMNAQSHEHTEKLHGSESRPSGIVAPVEARAHSPGLLDTSAGKALSVSKESHALMNTHGEAYGFERQSDDAIVRKEPGSGPAALEIGLPGGAHGWLRVRAELSDGAVHASVSSTSVAGAEMLRRELPSLTMYLHQEQVPVGSLVVHAGAGAQDSSGTANSTGDNGAGRQQQNSQAGGDRQESSSSQTWDESGWLDGVGEELAGWIPQTSYAGGGWLSVRA